MVEFRIPIGDQEPEDAGIQTQTYLVVLQDGDTLKVENVASISLTDNQEFINFYNEEDDVILSVRNNSIRYYYSDEKHVTVLK